MKETHMIAGLPRSGSTLLTNILNQNPKFKCEETSGLHGMLELVLNNWENEHHKVSYRPGRKQNVMKGMVHMYYAHHKEEVSFDKNRGWPSLTEFLIKNDHKIILTVRDLVDIVASFEKIYRKHKHNITLPYVKDHFERCKTLAGRCELLVSGEGIIGRPYSLMVEAYRRGLKDHFHIVEFEDLTNKPEETIRKLYEFLGYEYYNHDFDNVEQTIFEADHVRGYPPIHNIRSKVEPIKSNALEILGEELYNKYSNSEFWRK